MKSAQRRAAIAAYKEARPAAGIFAVRCEAEGAAWIGTSTTLEKFENRLWFSLRQGVHPQAALQRAFNTHGDGAIRVEILEQLRDDTSDIARPRVLKERQAHWMAKLGAARL